jgi:hypothetical protein
METRTCKTCKETKDRTLFRVGTSLVCKKCTNHQERIKYFQKKGIESLPPKINKYNSLEERKAGKLAYLRKRDKKEREVLSDHYIKNQIRSRAISKGVKPDFSDSNIIKVREGIKKTRLAETLSTKQCIECQKVFDKKLGFPKSKSNRCKKCHQTRHYKKYGRAPYTPDKAEGARKRYQLNKEMLTTGYIKHVIKSNLRHVVPIRYADISEVFVDLKRKEITLNRKINGKIN